MLSLRSTTAAPRACGPRPASRRVAVPVRAGLGEALNNIGQAFVKIFSPPNDDAPNGNWAGTASSFTGRIDHGGHGRPFKDGFTGARAAAGDAAAAAAEATQEARNEAADYVSGAVEGLMAKNFPGKEDADQPTTGAEGWKGDIHTRKRDGFHNPRV